MSKKIINLSDFLDNDLGNYSFYKVLTQIPELTDGMSITQRKIQYILLTKIPDKKTKTAQMYSYLLNETNYVHGDASVYNATENMAAKYKNSISLIEPFANFGTRTIQSASSPRYTELKLSKISKEIFPKDDFNILPDQEFEGKIIEPFFIAPIIPIGLINGNNGIALGYKSQILPRNPIDIFNMVKGILKKDITKLPVSIAPWYPYFKGEITQGDSPSQWVFKGILSKKKKRGSTGIIEITEVPFYSREKYILKLNKLADLGHIKSFNDDCKKNNFYFEIRVPLDVYSKSEEELLDLFGLIVKQSETLTFIKRDDVNIELLQYSNIAEYFRDWIQDRIKLYQERKNYVIEKMEEDIKKLENRIRFIKAINSEELVIKDKKKSAIIKEMKNQEFNEIDNSFDYLLNMPLWNLTSEKIKELEKKLKEEVKKLKDYVKTSLTDLWLKDLDVIEPLIHKEVKEKV